MSPSSKTLNWKFKKKTQVGVPAPTGRVEKLVQFFDSLNNPRQWNLKTVRSQMKTKLELEEKLKQEHQINAQESEVLQKENIKIPLASETFKNFLLHSRYSQLGTSSMAIHQLQIHQEEKNLKSKKKKRKHKRRQSNVDKENQVVHQWTRSTRGQVQLLPSQIIRSTDYRPLDPIFNDQLIKLFVGALTRHGKKTKAERIMRDVFAHLKSEGNVRPAQTLAEASQQAQPMAITKRRRIRGASYEIPMPLYRDRAVFLGVRALVQAARSRAKSPSVTISQGLALELRAALANEGSAMAQRKACHELVLKNQAFAHFRWAVR